MTILIIILFCALLRLGIEITKEKPNWGLCCWIVTGIFLTLKILLTK